MINNPDRTDWDSQRRLTLLGNFQILTEQLWDVGVDEVYIAGSFVEEKDRPNDIDGYFVADFKDIVNKNKDGLKGRLRAQESKIWTWDRADLIYVPEIGKKALPMRVKYDVEMYPDYPGAFSGIRDRRNKPLGVSEAFRLCRSSGIVKGIIKTKKPKNPMNVKETKQQ